LARVQIQQRKKVPKRDLLQLLRTARLRGGRLGLLLGIDADLVARLALVLELHDAVDERVDRVVGPESDVAARVPLGAALADDDVARDHALATELLDATVLRVAVATVAGGSYALFMCHVFLSLRRV